jgi:hypothetical protein
MPGGTALRERWREMKPELILACVSVTAAIFSACMAFRSSCIARRALRLNEANQAKQEAPLSVYLADSFRYRTKGHQQKQQILAFSISVTNRSTQPNSIVRIELHVDCVSDEGRKIEFVMTHNPLLASQIKQAQLTPFDCPSLFATKESRSRWALFSESGIVPPHVRRDAYRIVMTDTDGKTASVTSLIVGDLSDDTNAKIQKAKTR